MALHTFKITHLSDLHLGTVPQMRGLHHRAFGLKSWQDAIAQFFQAKCDLIALTGTYDPRVATALLMELERNDLTGGPDAADAILISGDICSIGRIEELRAASQYLLNSFNEIGIQLPIEKMVIMPGNHDRYHGNATFLAGSPHFESVDAFGSKWSAGNSSVLHPTPVRERRLRAPHSHGGLSIVCADFALTLSRSLARPVRHFDDGHVGDDVLQSLVTLSTTAEEEGFAVVWAIHFPPKFPWHRRQQLTGYKRLLEQARACNVRHIFSGHTHVQMNYKIPEYGNIWVHCAGTPTSDGSKSFDFMRHEIAVIEDRVGYVDTREFKYKRDRRMIDESTGGEVYDHYGRFQFSERHLSS